MKCSMSKLFRSFFIFVLILIIVFPATGFAAKTKKSSSADLKSNKNVQNTDMTKKYKKQMNNVLEATQLFYSVRLNYSMKSGESKKIKLTSLEKQNIAAGRQILEGQSRITNFHRECRNFLVRMRELLRCLLRQSRMSRKN